jgi:hypothetical protein
LTSAVTVALASITITSVASFTVRWPSVWVTFSVAVVATGRRAIFVSLIVGLYLVEKFIAELLRTGDTFRTRPSDMEVHGLLALLAGLWLHEAWATALDLNFAAGLLLDILDVITAAADYLCSQIEPAYWLKSDGDLLLRPFALYTVSLMAEKQKAVRTYSAELVTLKVFGLATTETTLIY